MIRLYTTPLSANGRKVMAVARHLALDVEIVTVNVYAGEGQRPEYLAVNPTGKIPTLVDGDFHLRESNAILEYLAEGVGGFALSSRDPRERARIHAWLYWEASQWQPALVEALAPAVGHILVPEHVPAPEAAPDWSAARLAQVLGLLEAELDGALFIGSEVPTIADFSVAGMTTYFARTGFPFASFPNVAAWCERMQALDAWRATEVDLWRAP